MQQGLGEVRLTPGTRDLRAVWMGCAVLYTSLFRRPEAELEGFVASARRAMDAQHRARRARATGCFSAAR